jgi:hypothetical protein
MSRHCRQVPTDAGMETAAPKSGAASHPGHRTLEHVLKKLLDFFDSDMLQRIDLSCVPIDQMILFDRDAL